MAQYCRVPSEQVRLFGDYVESPQNRSVGLVVWWSPVYVCIIGRAVSFVFSFAMLGSRCDNDASDRDQDNDAVVDHLYQIDLWFSFAQRFAGLPSSTLGVSEDRRSL